MKSWRAIIAIAALLGFGALSSSAFGADQARPGTVNYVEGAVYLDGQPLNNKDVGSTAMNAGDVVSTRQGKVEILLNPGIYLRVDDNSAVKMISPDLTPSEVEVEHGRAGVEVDQLLKQNVVQIVDHGVTTELTKTGYYEFNADNPSLTVTQGEAEVQFGNSQKKVKGGHELALDDGADAKEAKFRPDPQTDELMNWSKLRSQYLSEANNEMAAEAYGPGVYPGGYYPGWYWNPGLWGYTYMGASPFYSPFGWGFAPMGGWYGGLGWYSPPVVIGGFHGGFHEGWHRGGFHGRSGLRGGIIGGSHGRR